MAKKAAKKRASKYDKKLAIRGDFADVIKISVQPVQSQEPAKKAVKKKK